MSNEEQLVSTLYKTAPEEIFLNVGDHVQYYGEAFPDDRKGVDDQICWSRELADVCGVRYIRADRVAVTWTPPTQEGH